MNKGVSPDGDRAGGPADLSRCASQPKALIPDAWEPIETAPFTGDIVWVSDGFAMCPSYFYLGAWRNWFKGPRYENVKLSPEAYAPASR